MSIRISAIAIIILIFVSATGTGRMGASQKDKDSSELLGSRIELPSFDKEALLNGLQLLIFPERVAGKVPFILMIKNGAAFDPMGKWGATYVMSRMMLESTERFSGEKLRADLAAMDSELSVKVTWDAIFFQGQAPANRISEVLGLLAEVVVRPRFEEETFQEVRSQVVQEVKEKRARVESATQLLFQSRLFGANPYGHSVKGNPQTLNELYLRDIKIQYRRLMMPNQAYLAFYHEGDRGELLSLLGRQWGAWVRGKAAPFTFRRAAPLTESSIVLSPVDNQSSMLRWGRLGVEKSSPDFHALKVFEHYLTLALPGWAREIASANHVRASFRVEARRMPGYLQFNVQAPKDQLFPYYERLKSLLNELRQGSLNKARFEEARILALQEFKAQLESPFSRLRVVLETELYDSGINFITTYGLRLDRVSPASFQQILRQRLGDPPFVMVVAAPEGNFAGFQGEDGAVEILN